MSRPARFLWPLAIVAAAAAAGCRTPGIDDRPFRSHPIVREGPRVLLPVSESDEAAFGQSRDRVESPAGATACQLVELADSADAIGTRLIHRDPIAALPWFRDAAAYAMFGLMRSGAGDEGDPLVLRSRAIARHNHAVESLLRCAGTGPDRVNPAWREQLAAVGVEVAATKPDRGGLPLDELWIASDFRVKNLEEVRRDGLGVPLVVLSLFPNREALPDHFMPPKLRLPATAELRPVGTLEGGDWRSRPLTLALHDPAREAAAPLGPAAGEVPLAADLTTPLAHQMTRSPFTEISWGGLYRPEAYSSAMGIYMEAPYQPGKIPVLFIHGLWSSPDVWLAMANSLQGDPLLRDRYQFWFAFYPTGAPVMISAVGLRKSLQGLREAIDPEKKDAALDQMVLVGHSLGGVLSRQMLLTSGDALERALFTRPFAEVAMSPDARTLLSEGMHFEPVPSVRRAVFIAAPHHGSSTAGRFIGRLGSTLVRRSGKLEAIHAEVVALNGPEVLQPFYRRRPPSSIDNLVPESPILETLSALPIAEGVPYHSVIANLFPDAAPKHWNDGLVSYDSAHLDGAESEVMIRHNHFANDTPEAIAEVHRILRLHLGVDDGAR